MISHQSSVIGKQWRAIGALVAGLAICVSAATFDAQREAMRGAVVTQRESAIMALLGAGLKEGKAMPAFAETQTWLRQNQATNEMLLYYAGRAAELSGEWRGAVALYQQYLKNADLTSVQADDATHAVYVLLLERLKDTESAYVFSRNEGNSLLVCPRARQFDEWFLGEATRRNDITGVANRLHACIEAGLPTDLLLTRYSRTFVWLLSREPNKQEEVNACKQLAGVVTFSDELALRLDVAAKVNEYNAAKMAGKDVEAPTAEAAALLAKHPRYAKWVQDRWARGGSGYDVPARKACWLHEVDGKMGPIVAALPKLPPVVRSELLQTWRNRHHYDGGPAMIDVNVVSNAVKANPALARASMTELPLVKHWAHYKPEEVAEMAPKVEANADSHASFIRAAAAAGNNRDYDKALAALRGPELWRLDAGQVSQLTDQLWHYCRKSGGNQKRDAEIAKSKEVAAGIAAKQIKKDAPAAQRLAEFRKLWADYRSPRPRIQGVVSRLPVVLQFTPEAVPELLRDPDPEAQRLVRDAITRGFVGTDPRWALLGGDGRVDCTGYGPLFLNHQNRHGLAWLKENRPEICKPHPLEGALRKTITDGLAQNKLIPWQVMAWINMQYPEDNAEQVKLMKAIHESPPWKTMPFEVQYAAREWFKNDILTPRQRAWLDAADPSLFCKDLLSLANVSDVATASAALHSAIDGAMKSPVRVGLHGLDQLGSVSNSVFADPTVFDQALTVVDQLRESGRADGFGRQLLEVLKKNRDPVQLHRAGAGLWLLLHQSEDRHFSFGSVLQLTQSLLEEHPATAGALARIGTGVYDGVRSANGFRADRDLKPLRDLFGMASVRVGVVRIPVAKTHPSYPIYKSQAEWLSGNEDTAWQMVDAHWGRLLPIHRELSPKYLNWVLQRVIHSRDAARQEPLIKALLKWSAEHGSPWSREQRVDLDVAHGDIALQRGQLLNAHKIFVQAQQNGHYRGMPDRHKATLRRAMVERYAKRFDDALHTLDVLDRERIPEFWAASRCARAEVLYDMEEYEGAAGVLEAILVRFPDHVEANILQGKVQLRRQMLMEASELDVGSRRNRETLTLGEKLKVTLNDPTLAVSGVGTEIEVAVWATSGDRETFFLRQFGDEKSKFRGEVETVLGKPSPNDNVLQVIGDDKIHYAYSEAFRKRMNNIDEMRGGPITVKSDAVLIASARKLPTVAEQRAADMRAMMADLSEKRDLSLTDEQKAHRARAPRVDDARVETMKPGKAIKVRVIDPDRSRTAEIDELVVSVESSNGDSVPRVVLKETSTHSGCFEGRVQTEGAQAMAFAENSEPGRNPNMVISPTQGYPAWKPVAVEGATPVFRIDLTDAVELGKMTITAQEPSAKLKVFHLRAGTSQDDMRTIGAYPARNVFVEYPWRPSVTIMNDTDHHQAVNERSVYDIRELAEHLSHGWTTQRFAVGIAENVSGVSEAMANTIPRKVRWLRQNNRYWPAPHVIYRFRGYFYEKSIVTRRFKLALGAYEIPKKVKDSERQPAQFMLAVDGRPITNPKEPDKLGGEVQLRPGLHRFEIWAIGWHTSIGYGRSITLFANVDDSETLEEVPDRFFDPSRFPRGTLPQRNGKAVITADEAGTTFTVKFAPDSKTRILELVLKDHEGSVPVLNRIALTEPDGTRVLPVEHDYATLNKNDRLELINGDRVAVRYVDDRCSGRENQKHERFLGVGFRDASIGFVFRETGPEGKLAERPERLLRYVHGEPLHLMVTDADEDTTDRPDTVNVTLVSKSGGERTFKARETGPSTGMFVLEVVPLLPTLKSESGFRVGAGEEIAVIYRDQENSSPGMTTDRYASVVPAVFAVPKLHLSHATVTPGTSGRAVGLRPGFAKRRSSADIERMSAVELRDWEEAQQSIRPRWHINNRFYDTVKPPTNGIEVVHGQMMTIAVQAAHLAVRVNSTVSVYVQTDSGRTRAAERDATQAFDITAPGTIELIGTLPGSEVRRWDRWLGTPRIPIYTAGRTEAGDGPGWGAKIPEMFSCQVPLIAAFPSNEGVVSKEEIARRRESREYYAAPHGLVVKPGEKIHVGIRYEDEKGVETWLTGSARVITHPVLDVMDEDYREDKTTVRAAESVYLRVVDLGADVTDGSDTVWVLMQAKSGAKHMVELLEVDTHSGVFLANTALTYANEQTDSTNASAYSVKRDGFPVVYGDTVGVWYKDAQGQRTETKLLTVGKGASGSVRMFAKRHDDPEIGMRTQFALAEAYLEMAKQHRNLRETERAQDEYARAKELLNQSMGMFHEPDIRAHAQFLLANLTQEEAESTGNAELKEERYRAALSRYMKVVGNYPDTIAASKAQFKIATVYETLKEPDIAAQEYVKLAYKYPESEFLAMAMARLGTHFQRKASMYEKKAKQLLAETDDEESQMEGKAMKAMSEKEYVKAAGIYGRLQDRFPSHLLAGMGGLRSGQAYMRAGETGRALKTFERVIKEKSYDGVTIRAEAMYWGGMCHEEAGDGMAAFSLYKRLTYDFPETKWAAYARGRLVKPAMQELQEDLENRQLREGR